MSAEHVLTMLNEHEVKFVDLRFTDTKGKEQHVTIPAHQVNAEFFEEGKMFDGSSIGGWKGINESDMVLMPDASTAVIDPFFADSTLIIRCDILEPGSSRLLLPDGDLCYHLRTGWRSSRHLRCHR